ncbi:MAG: lysine--tRNA ligase [Blastocatellia bacterium]
MSITQFEEIVEPNDQTEARREHLEKLRELVGNVYPNKFERSRVSGDEDTITRLLRFEPVDAAVKEIVALQLGEREKPTAEVKDRLNAALRSLGNVSIAGRLAVPPRVMGKAAFVHLSDGISRIQIYVRRDDVQAVVGLLTTVSGWKVFQLLDHGDFIGVEGYLFITNTGELSVHVEKLQFLAKAMLPMPDKMHGIADPEIRQRQRYIDLIGSSLQIKSEPPASAGGQIVEQDSTNWPTANAGGSALTTREVFERRAKITSSMRRYLEDHGYVEVETPMLTPKATGATAKPFVTHHNTLDIDLYARIAPELYLKRLVVGGFEKVYELNRNFRNEGISYKHNPEFTMLEFYCAYMDVNGMMDFCEELIKESVQKASGGLAVNYEGNEIDFSKFERISMKGAIVEYRQEFRELGGETITESSLNDLSTLRALRLLPLLLDEVFVEPTVVGDDIYKIQQIREEQYSKFVSANKDKYWAIAKRLVDGSLTAADILEENIGDLGFWNSVVLEYASNPNTEKAKIVQFIFEDYIEKRIVQPTFIVDYPKSISPLSKASPDDPQIAERFELFINGMEVANGFSELNDPKEQLDRFNDQMSERERGDEEAMVMDEDYIRALSYGMPPAAGIGIGIDRLVMLLTNKHSIRDVILFPHMRPEKREEEKGSEGEGETES